MTTQIAGLLIGSLFGASLILSGFADPDKIIGTLRLKDFHVMKTIIVFILVSMLGTWILGFADLANFSVKPAALLAVLAGGAILGVGFGLTGYCPGTGLACAASGRLDALVSVVGMLAGALVFILIYPALIGPLDALLNYGKVTLPEITKVPTGLWIGLLTVIFTMVLIALGLRNPKTT